MTSVVRRFADRSALDGVDLTIAAGEIHALLGPNGAGKTTLIRILAGLARAQAGSVQITGPVGLVPSGDRSFYLRISGLENLIFFARLNGLHLRAARERARHVLGEVGLVGVGSLPVGRFSHGMQKRLSVARALLLDPPVLLVDEATHDLDPEGARCVRSLIADRARQGAAVLWATQRVEEIRGFADSVTFLHRGRVRFAGSVSELVQRAPSQRYVVRVRSGAGSDAPLAAALQLAIGSVARVAQAPGGEDQFVLVPHDRSGLGAAVGGLSRAGFDVVDCRQERADIEEAFLALTAEAAA